HGRVAADRDAGGLDRHLRQWPRERHAGLRPSHPVRSVYPTDVPSVMPPIRDSTAAQEAGARTRHLNIWVRADATLSSLRGWQEATKRRYRWTTPRARSVIWDWIWPAAPTSPPWRSWSPAGMSKQAALRTRSLRVAISTRPRWPNSSYP